MTVRKLLLTFLTKYFLMDFLKSKYFLKTKPNLGNFLPFGFNDNKYHDLCWMFGGWQSKMFRIITPNGYELVILFAEDWIDRECFFVREYIRGFDSYVAVQVIQ